MKRFIPLLALFAAGAAASFALASPPPGKGKPTSSTATSEHGNSGAKCHPVNLKGNVTGGTISLAVTKAAGTNAQQYAGKTVSLTINGHVSVQAWSCAAASSSGSAPTTQTLFLKQLHVGGSPQNPGSTITTASGP
jgi:hypothetical protein